MAQIIIANSLFWVRKEKFSLVRLLRSSPGPIQNIPFYLRRYFDTLSSEIFTTQKQRIPVVDTFGHLKGFISPAFTNTKLLAAFNCLFVCDNQRSIRTSHFRQACFQDATWIVIEPGKTKFKAVDSFSNFTVNKSMHNDFIEKIDKKITLYDKEIERLTDKLIAKHSEGKQDEVAQLRDSIKIKKQEIRNNVYLSFAKANPNSFLSLYALYQSLGYGLDSNVVRDVLSGLDRLTEYVQQYPTAQFLRTTLEAELNVGLGRIAPDFIQNDTVNNAISLSSFRGKYMLLEFWGSWCLPCRAERPNLIKAYNYFHSKGFEILSVSLERKEDREKWLKAIRDDKLAWTHVTDFKYWSNEVAKKYNVSEVPKNFLIDPKGKIIAKDLRGDALFAN